MEWQLLSNEQMKHYCNKILMPEGATAILLEIGDLLEQDEKLLHIHKQFYTSYIESGYWTTVWEPLKIDPYAEEVLGNHASLLYLHAALQRLPLTEKRYKELGLSEEFFVETVRDISTWVQNAYNLVGYYAIRNFSWIWRHLEARMFRIGSIQYLTIPFSGDVKGFYHAENKTLMLLCREGIELRASGDMQGVCKKEKTEDGFVTTYEETDDYYIGHPVTPEGKGMPSPVKLSRLEWEKVLDKDDIVFDIHIPRDAAFDMDSVKESYKQAKQFFAKHFPEVKPKGMYCHTWLFTPQLRDMLPPTSNIVKFQEQFYLYPTAGSISFLWNFVFNEMLDVKDAKPDTSLRRKVLEYVEQEKEIFDMRGIFLDLCGEFGEVSYDTLKL
ncbi:acyltransferase domain-containing protein [Paenibacillus camelliae]|uniref:acyltransferase domain-containing protein n=1 Tax=Paenibacillus camelliae TaxID=512410 RepID=UPI002040BF52|nr:acyltransferase domain-containing protein [Paenibacillus camelliae]MCM3634920.1 acyltransferase domain-containing protein [Paenibacillus camelliae]